MTDIPTQEGWARGPLRTTNLAFDAPGTGAGSLSLRPAEESLRDETAREWMDWVEGESFSLRPAEQSLGDDRQCSEYAVPLDR
jgi:hypothetical protein